MAKHPTVWSADDVAARFHEAVVTGRRLPPVRVQGYFNLWPPIVRQEWERYAEPDRVIRFPPEPVAIDRMLEAMGWVQWLEVESRHLVWMRADNYEWNHGVVPYKMGLFAVDQKTKTPIVTPMATGYGAMATANGF